MYTQSINQQKRNDILETVLGDKVRRFDRVKDVY